MAASVNACRAGENAVAALNVPIIFVPGIMGSRFDIPSVSDKWDADSNTNMLGWAHESTPNKRRKLHFGNPGLVMYSMSDDKTDKREKLGWGGLRWKSYGDFMKKAESWQFGCNQTPIYAYGYDWRQPIMQLGCQLAADIIGQDVNKDGNSASPSLRFGSSGILGQTKADKCLIITHSMGGLVTRAALKACDELAGKTVGVLHGVQPATGSPLMFRRLITGAYSPYDGSDTASSVLSSILGKTGEEFGNLVSVIAGAMQLLPSNLYRDACEAWMGQLHYISWTTFEENRTPSHWSSESVYDTYKRLHTETPPGGVYSTLPDDVKSNLRTRIDGVKRFHDFIGDWKLQDKTWTFFGSTEKSDVTLHFNLPPKSYTLKDRIFRDPECKTTDSSGKEVILDYETDIRRNGFSPTVPDDMACDRTTSGFSFYGDGTVSAVSGSALFTGRETALFNDFKYPNYAFATNHQFSVAGIEHEPAYRDAGVQQFTQAWIDYMISTIPRN